MKIARFLFVMLACLALAGGIADAAASIPDVRGGRSGHAAKPRRPAGQGPAQLRAAKKLPKLPARSPSALAASPQARPLRLPASIKPVASGLSLVPHRSPNPAIIAGSPNPNRRNTGALDGRQVHRRP